MQIEEKGLLTQLGYHPDEVNLKLLKVIRNNTPGFEQIKKHILALHDHLKNFDGFIAISNSKPYFKIKIETKDPHKQKSAKEEIQKWADKYNVKLQKVTDKETYYILGID